MLLWKSYHIIHSDLQTKLVLRNIFCLNENFPCDKSDFSCFKNSFKAIKMFGRHFIPILIVLLVKWKIFWMRRLWCLNSGLDMTFRGHKTWAIYSQTLNLEPNYSHSFLKPLELSKNGRVDYLSIYFRPSFKRFIKSTEIDEISPKSLANPDVCGSII